MRHYVWRLQVYASMLEDRGGAKLKPRTGLKERWREGYIYLVTLTPGTPGLSKDSVSCPIPRVHELRKAQHSDISLAFLRHGTVARL
ncbi:MAG: hypothetical protein JWP34_4522 [Massilia sp.]|nr:hypothetical protein [Massilia sp.]